VAFWFAFVSTIHSGTVRVPDVAGRTLEEARRVLVSSNLAFVLDSRLAAYSDDIKPGGVVRQDPRGGSTIKQGNTVRLGISLGPARVTLPNLVGKTVQESEMLLKGQALEAGDFGSLAWPGREPGRVVAQQPPADALQPPTVRVDLLLASADSVETYVMPDCAGKPLESVREEFLRRGFKLEKVREISLSHYQEGIIMAQTPPAGYRLFQRDGVVLTVNRRNL